MLWGVMHVLVSHELGHNCRTDCRIRDAKFASVGREYTRRSPLPALRLDYFLPSCV